MTPEEPPIIEVRNVVKEYRLGALEGLRTLGRRLLGKTVPARQRFRALDDVSFSVKRGEVLGIIGHNGAGKSTLLKLLCNITTPTSGTVSVRGRIAPLIEVGAGLVGDMTGRENIYLNASILGMSRAQIEGKVEEIIAFAELEQFIDTPIKRYSSGMQIRLGFAIATSVEADILIIDEVLAVGDLAFQRKCYERIDRLISDSQKCILVVGHNIRQLERMCTKLMLLDHGALVSAGNPTEIANRFLRLSGPTLDPTAAGSVRSSEEQTYHQARIESVAVFSQGKGAQCVEMHAPLCIRLIIYIEDSIESLEIVAGIHTSDFLYITLASSASSNFSPTLARGRYFIDMRFTDNILRPGVYYVGAGLYDRYSRQLFRKDDLASFCVQPGDVDMTRRPTVGLVDVRPDWAVTQSSNPTETSAV